MEYGCFISPQRLLMHHRISHQRARASTIITHATPAPRSFSGLLSPHAYGSAPPPQPDEHPPWWSQVIPTELPSRRKIFCNRALNMKGIKAIGFDMDYTLAQYKPETFEALAYEKTVEKLVNVFGYPPSLKDLTFDWEYMAKGLIIDKKRGNTLKVDRHKYVKLAYHGFKPLPNEERKGIYNSTDHSFDEPDFAMVDTLFSLAEGHLFVQLVDLKDKELLGPKNSKPYSELYKDLRASVDMCHRDGSLKKAVAADPPKFIHLDPLLPSVLKTLRSSGRKVFIATNSLWDFTNVVMNYLLLGKSGSDKSLEWLSYFDVVFTGCQKPAFFEQGMLFQVDIQSGLLCNTDNGAPTVSLDTAPSSVSIGQPSPSSAPHSSAKCDVFSHQKAPVFQGGSYRDVHRMFGIKSGEEVLYVGDHIIGDIVTSKSSVGWRTMLVVPELDVELSMLEPSTRVNEELRLLRDQRDRVDDEIHRFEWAVRSAPPSPSLDPNPPSASPAEDGKGSESLSSYYDKNLTVLEELKLKRVALKERHTSLLANHHHQFHPIWGQLLKTGHQNSRFAHQVERFACLYTSHVSNLSYYSPETSYRGRIDLLAHEDAKDGLFSVNS